MLSERIETILRETGTKIGVLGDVAGVSSGTASMWLTGQIKSIKLQYAIKIQRKYGYNATWIVLGEGPKTLVPQSNDLSPTIQALALRVGALSSQRRARIESIISAWLVDAEQLDKLEAIEQGSNPALLCLVGKFRQILYSPTRAPGGIARSQNITIISYGREAAFLMVGCTLAS